MIATLRIVFAVVFVVAGALEQRASAQQPGSEAAIRGSTETEKWVWEHYQAGREADFNARCKRDPVEAGKPPEDTWDTPCRSISANFLQRILLGKAEGVPTSHRGLRIRGAEIVGELDLTAARIEVPIEFLDSLFTDRLVLDRARLSDTLSLSGSIFESDISAYGLVVEGSLIVRDNAVVKGKLDLLGAQIQGTLELISSTLHAGVDAEFVRVRDHVLLRSINADDAVHFQNASVGGFFIAEEAKVRSVTLEAATIGARLSLSRATIDGELNASHLRVNGAVFLDGTTFRGETIFSYANIQDYLGSDGARFEGGLFMVGARFGKRVYFTKAFFGKEVLLSQSFVANDLKFDHSKFGAGIEAFDLRVGEHLQFHGINIHGVLDLKGSSIDGSLDLTNATLEKGARLNGVKIGTFLALNESTVRGEFDLRFADVKAGLDVMNATIDTELAGEHLRSPSVVLSRSTFTAAAMFQYARIGVLDLSEATLPGLSLDGAEISTELRLTSAQHPTNWQSGGFLSLVNARAKLLVDEFGGSTPSCSAGGTWPDVLRLNGFTFEQLDSTFRSRATCWHRNWLERDSRFPLQSYIQLAGILRLAGDATRADAILYEGRNREMREAWQKGEYAHFLGLGALRYTIGYGIGGATFRILYWVAGFTILGAAILWFSAAARAKGAGWCLGASLDHLLPIVQLNKEFVDFFDDPDRDRLNGYQHAYFAFHALVGFLLGSFVVAALAGVTKG